MGEVIAFLAGCLGVIFVWVGLRRRRFEARDTLLILYTGGLALIVAGCSSLVL